MHPMVVMVIGRVTRKYDAVTVNWIIKRKHKRFLSDLKTRHIFLSSHNNVAFPTQIAYSLLMTNPLLKQAFCLWHPSNGKK